MGLLLTFLLLVAPAPLPETGGRAPKDSIEALRRAAESVVHVRVLRDDKVEQSLSGASISVSGGSTYVATSPAASRRLAAEGRRFQVVPPGLDAIEAEWIGLDDRTGIALIRIALGSRPPIAPARGLPARPGGPLYAAVNPLGIQANVTRMSLRGTRILPPGDTLSCMRLELERPISPGDAGGILLDEKGRAVALISGGADGAGAPAEPDAGLAIPMEVVVRVCGCLAKTGEVRRGHVGATFGWLDDESRLRYGPEAFGILVLEVRPGGPAARAGLRAGDLVTEVGGMRIRSLRNALTIAERVEFELVGKALRLSVFRPSPDGPASVLEPPEITIEVEPLPGRSPSAPARSASSPR